jgi:hypothetical protein
VGSLCLLERASLGQSVVVSLKRRCPDDEEPEDNGEEHFRTRPSGIPLRKRIFRHLLALFILSSNVAERIVENTYFPQLLVPTVKEHLIGRNTIGRDIVKLWHSNREDLKFHLGRHIASGGMISLTLVQVVDARWLLSDGC